MNLFRSLAVCLLFNLLYPVAVVAEEGPDPAQHLKRQNMAKMHGVHSSKVREVMSNLIGQLMMAPGEAGDEKDKAEYYARLAKLSRKVSRTALSIDRYLPNDELSEEEAMVFRDLAVQLYRESRNMEQHIEFEDSDALNAALERFNQTCVDCHRLFRERKI